MKKVLSFLLVTLFSISLIAGFQVASFTLENGLHVILSPDEDVKATCVLLYHLNGARDDPSEIKGGSYLYQYLMYMETENLDPYELIMFVRKGGGEFQGKINHDNSIFFQIIADHNLNNALWLESERLKSLKITDYKINLHKNNIYNRITSLLESNVNYRARQWIKKMIFQGTTYETPIYGNLEEIRTFNNDKIRKIYNKYRNPKNIIMVISGKFDNMRIRELIEKYFSHLEDNSESRKHDYNNFKPRASFITKNWVVSNTSQHFIFYGFRAPARLSFDELYFKVICYYLVDDRISRLEKIINGVYNLDVDITYECTDNFESNAFIIRIASPRRISIEKAKYIVNKELQALQTNPLSHNTVNEMKLLMEMDKLKEMNKIDKRSIMLAENFHLFGDLNFKKTYINRLKKLSSYDIIRIAKKYFGKKNLVMLNVYKK